MFFCVSYIFIALCSSFTGNNSYLRSTPARALGLLEHVESCRAHEHVKEHELYQPITNCRITSGTDPSNPITSSIPASVGSAILKSVAVNAATTSFAGIPVFSL